MLISALSPNGPAAEMQKQLMFEAIGLMAIVVLPVFVLTIVVLWRYRADRHPDDYAPDWDYSLWLDVSIWLIPALIVVAIGFLQWTRTQTLDPYSSSDKALQIQAIALDWKWLFLYPKQGVATLNHFVVPAGKPFEVSITSDTAMSAFFIPGLGGQIYAMAGMETKMNLTANNPSTMWGRNTQFTGEGFSNHEFTVKVVTHKNFTAWVSQAANKKRLNQSEYEQLRVPSQKDSDLVFSGFPEHLFSDVINRYRTPDRKTP